MGIIFYLLLHFLSEKLNYFENYKIIYLLFSIFIAIVSYIITSIFFKAFKLSDINLNYK